MCILVRVTELKSADMNSMFTYFTVEMYKIQQNMIDCVHAIKGYDLTYILNLYCNLHSAEPIADVQYICTI